MPDRPEDMDFNVEHDGLDEAIGAADIANFDNGKQLS